MGVCNEQSQLLANENQALHELGAQQIFQILISSLTNHTYAMKDAQINELFFHIFREKNFPVLQLIGTRFSLSVLENNQGKAKMRCEMSIPTAFEAEFYFHGISFMLIEDESKMLNIIRNNF